MDVPIYIPTNSVGGLPSICLHFDIEISLSEIYPAKIITHVLKNIYSRMFLELWFIKAKNGNNLNAIVIVMMVTMNRGTLNKN